MRDKFDITPEQYHAGVDQLWCALGLTGPQDKDVFTLAMEEILRQEKMLDALPRTKDGVIALPGMEVDTEWAGKRQRGKVLMFASFSGLYLDVRCCTAINK